MMKKEGKKSDDDCSGKENKDNEIQMTHSSTQLLTETSYGYG
jgi:hypothetical protein